MQIGGDSPGRDFLCLTVENPLCYRTSVSRKEKSESVNTGVREHPQPAATPPGRQDAAFGRGGDYSTSIAKY